ncbi:uncharacterized protein LOC126904335 [Daktulosphaira vitifoliae]|uniref:uncharacterized protein LOC126904335 n=1 Tax=Daktulosphaira vitifoliae TaxID=58002 RepID=UPI0021AA5760|nr:uncharacterized protein LOC126904335 [Daktulosphaira vitifoliae]
MMHSEALVWLTTGIGGPLSIVWLCWAILVLWFGRGQWRPSDPLLIALLGEAIAKQIASSSGSALSLFRPDEPALCSAVQWLWTAAHTMQAGTLASLALMAGLRRKKSTVAAGGRPLLLYHLASLSIVSACVGAASLIAQADPCAPPTDRRYAVFSLVLHASLAVVALTSAALGCAAGRKKGPPNPLLVSSSSDLSSCMSDLSTVSSCSRGGIRHSVSDCSDRVVPYRSDCALVQDLMRLPTSPANGAPLTFLNGGPRALLHQDHRHQFNHQDDTLRRLDETKRLIDTNAMATTGTLDSYATSTMGLPPYKYGSRYLPSTTSMSASSTNSRAPCLAKKVSLVQDVSIGYAVAILFMCYFVDHIPVLMLLACEHFMTSSLTIDIEYEPVVKNFPMLAALAEACLWPIVLLLFDDQFVPRLSNLYRRQSASDMAKPPQGLHGKFRPYNGSLQDTRRPPSSNSGGGGGSAGGESASAAHRFPITNGSLFASLDGRVPVLHHYRRGARAMSGLLVSSSSPSQVPCSSPHFIHTQNSASQSSPLCCSAAEDEHFHHRHQNRHRFTNMVVASLAEIDSLACKDDCATPADSLNEVQHDMRQRLPQNLQQLREKLFAADDEDEDAAVSTVDLDVEDAGAVPATLDSSDDSEEGNRYDNDDDNDDDVEYATLSARSVCSATTAANDDFEYFAAASGKRSTAKANNRVNYQRAPTRRARHQHQQNQRHSKPSPLPPTPPTPRRPRPRLTTMLSVDSLVTARTEHNNFDHHLISSPVHRHRHNQQQRHRAGRRMGGRGHHGGSVPDLKRVFITDFL